MVLKVILNRSGGRRHHGGVVSYRSDRLPVVVAQPGRLMLLPVTKRQCVHGRGYSPGVPGRIARCFPCRRRLQGWNARRRRHPPGNHMAVVWDCGQEFNAIVADLRAKGVTFERYEMEGASYKDGVYDANGFKMVWFKDPDGNILHLNSA